MLTDRLLARLRGEEKESTQIEKQRKRETNWRGREERRVKLQRCCLLFPVISQSEAAQDSVSAVRAASMTGVLMANSKRTAQREKMKSLNSDPPRLRITAPITQDQLCKSYVAVRYVTA